MHKLVTILGIVLLVAVVAVWNWQDTDMHSEDIPFRRLAVIIGTVVATLFTLFYVWDLLGGRWL